MVSLRLITPRYVFNKHNLDELMNKIIPVIMAGGSGTRLWPLSRKMFPKQFLSLIGDNTLFQETISRLHGAEIAISDPIIVCNDEHRFIVAEQLRETGQQCQAIILEPVGRNTAPAITLAALEAKAAASNGDDPLLLVLSADHVIRDPSTFRQTVAKAIPAALDNQLVTFGIVPGTPETGYGYIKTHATTSQTHRVERFVEKPDKATAEAYLRSGDYLWNSGMFMFKTSVLLTEMGEYRPDILQAVSAAFEEKTTDLDFTRIEENAFSLCPDESIDYAVMEKTHNAVAIGLDAGWSDVGSWSSLWEESEKDDANNVCHGDVLTEDAEHNLLFSDHKLVAAIGVDNLVIIDTPDALMVCAKDRVQDVKKIVKRLEKDNRAESSFHRKVARPWGSYDAVDRGEHFQVKRITVKPGAKLSLQKHNHRAEHWVIVSGTALVTLGEEQKTLKKNESVYIPVGMKHRLENRGSTPLEMIEVQSGDYLGEDDIVRFEDTYGRCP